MSLTPPPPVTRRDWTLPIIAGVVAIVVVLAACVVGSALAFVSLRREASPTAGPPAPSVLPTPLNAKSGPECLIGDWLEVDYVLTIPIGGSDVRFNGKGAVYRFEADGTFFQLLQNVVYTGSSTGNRYEIVVNGSMLLDYQATATTISYSNPVAEGTSTLKTNGTVSASEELEPSLTPEAYACQGNQLKIIGDNYVTDLQRI